MFWYAARLLEGRQSIQSTGPSSDTLMTLSPKPGDAESSSQHSSHSLLWYPFLLFVLVWVACYYATTQQQQLQQQHQQQQQQHQQQH